MGSHEVLVVNDVGVAELGEQRLGPSNSVGGGGVALSIAAPVPACDSEMVGAVGGWGEGGAE